MRNALKLRSALLLVVFALIAGACASDDDATSTEVEAEDTAATEAVPNDPTTGDAAMTDAAMTEAPMTEEAMTDDAMTEGAAGEEMASAEICDADALVAAVEGGPTEGTLAGMADDPVATAASSNPVLTTLVTAVDAAGLVDTLNGAEALTVFAPTDCAFADLDPATLEAALADPTGLLTEVLSLHVIPGERLTSADLSGEYTNFAGTPTTVEGTTVNGQAEIVVPDIETGNATVHLIDTVILPG